MIPAVLALGLGALAPLAASAQDEPFPSRPVRMVVTAGPDHAKVLEMPDVQEWYRNAGVDPVANTPAQFRDILRRDVDYWTRLVQTTGMRVE